MKMASYEDVDAYLAAVESEDKRAALVRLREIIREEVPDAEETISYGMPAYRKAGGVFIFYAAFKNHCSLFAVTTGGKFADELKDFKTSKGTIQFTPQKPLPEDLVRRIVRQRVVDHLEERSKLKPQRKK